MNPIANDPIDLLQQLSADQIAARIDHLDGEICSLRVLLRAARARERRCGQAGVNNPPDLAAEDPHDR